MRSHIVVLVMALATPGLVRPAAAQTLAQRITASDGAVEVIYRSRPDACGDGEHYIENVFGTQRGSHDDRDGWRERPCVHGPARVVATVSGGTITRLKTYVGPVPAASPDTRRIDAGVAETERWLADLVSNAPGRVASQAVLPLVLADTSDPWPVLLRVARDSTRPRELRRSAMTWLAMGVNDHLGLDASRDETADDEMRTQAVFVLSQRPRAESVPELMDLARSATRASVRRSAIFWLGQTGDPRAVDVFADLLGSRP